MIAENKAKRKLQAGGTALCCALLFRNSALAEFLGHNGFDAIMIDYEHSFVDADFVEEFAIATKYAGACPLVKTPVDEAQMMRYLDMGIMGFQVAEVKSADDVRRVVAAMKYPPIGRRGISPIRATRYSIKGDAWPAYQERANAETLLVCAIEDREGMAALPEIVKIPEVDAFELGTNDLANDLGITGASFDHPVLKAQIDRYIEIMVKAGKPYAIGASADADLMRANYAMGARWQITTTRDLLRTSTDALRAVLGEGIESP